MSDFGLIIASLRARWVNCLLSVLLTAFGVMMAVMIVMLSQHIQNRLSADGRNVDLVLGAKGSPLQIILSSVYHIDIPTGNISYAEAEKWMNHPQVKSAIPLALGDNYRGYRIVGTTPAYIDHYGATFAHGQAWTKPFEAVVGAHTGLALGIQFSGAHGLITGGHVHEDERYTVVGVLKPTGSVIDRLILTDIDSVLKIHGQEGLGHDDGHDHDHDHHHGHKKEKTDPEITAVLLGVKSPIAMMNLPPMINRQSALQAANPALEMARLTGMLGFGTRTLSAVSGVLIVVAALSIFAGLAGSFQNRAFDLALLRAIGFSRGRLMRLIIGEGILITLYGIILGLILAYGGFMMLSEIMAPIKTAQASPNLLTPDIGWIIFCVSLAGVLSAMLPAWRAARFDVADQLNKTK